METLDFISIMFLTRVDIVHFHKAYGSICWAILTQILTRKYVRMYDPDSENGSI